MVLRLASSRGRAALWLALAAAVGAVAPPGASAQRAQATSAQREAERAADRARVAGRRGWFGFSFQIVGTRRVGRAAAETVTVESVVSGSPADRAGLRRGDVLLRVASHAVTGRTLDDAAGRAQPGDTLRLTVRRGGQTRQLALVAAARPAVLHVVRGAGSGRLFLADSIAVRAQTILDSIRADVADVRMAVGGGASGDAPVVIIRDALGDVRSFRVKSADVNVVMRDLREALDRQRSSTPAEIRIESSPRGEDELRQVLRELEQLRRDQARVEIELDGARDSMPFYFEARGSVAPRYKISTSVSSLGVGGAEFTPLAPQMRSYFGVDSGLLVLRVGPGTPAARAQLLPGDVVIGAGGRRTRSVRELAAALREAGEDGLTLDVIRQHKRRTIRLPGP